VVCDTTIYMTAAEKVNQKIFLEHWAGRPAGRPTVYGVLGRPSVFGEEHFLGLGNGDAIFEEGGDFFDGFG
jgi:hypothetical protein